MAKQTFTTGQVLTAAQMTSLQQTAMLGGAASAKTASYTLVAADAGSAISMSNASATTITVNTALFAAGDTVHITNLGAGVCTITAGTATVNSSASLALAQYESGFLDFTSTSAAIFVKGAGAAAASGGMTLLSTTTLSGASTTISSIDQGYTNLYIVGQSIYNSVNNESMRIRVNGDSTAEYYYNWWGSSGTVFQGDYDNAGNSGFLGFVSNQNTAAETSKFTIDIPRYSETQVKYISSNSWAFTGASGRAYNAIQVYRITTAITSLTFFPGSGTWSGGTVYVYGVK